MPLYDYKCHICGHITLDALVSNNQAVLHHCRMPMERLACRPASIIVNGFNAENGYSHADEAFRPSSIPGIKTQVRRGRGVSKIGLP